MVATLSGSPGGNLNPSVDFIKTLVGASFLNEEYSDEIFCFGNISMGTIDPNET